MVYTGRPVHLHRLNGGGAGDAQYLWVWVPGFPPLRFTDFPPYISRPGSDTVPRIWKHAFVSKKPGTHMNHCNLAEDCFFFAVREYLTGLYCTGNFSDCARYRAALSMGQELVPDDIFPNEDDFLSLFAWSMQQPGNPISRRCRQRGPGRRPIPGSEKTAASSGRLPAIRQTRSQR